MKAAHSIALGLSLVAGCSNARYEEQIASEIASSEVLQTRYEISRQSNGLILNEHNGHVQFPPEQIWANGIPEGWLEDGRLNVVNGQPITFDGSGNFIMGNSETQTCTRIMCADNACTVTSNQSCDSIGTVPIVNTYCNYDMTQCWTKINDKHLSNYSNFD